MAINDWTNKTNKPPLYFPGLWIKFLTWIWNLRISYPYLEIYLANDDVTMAFHQIKYNPNLAGMHAAVINGWLFLSTGQMFGDFTSPPNWKPFANTRSQYASTLWHDPTIVKQAAPHLQKIQLLPEPKPKGAATLVQATQDSKSNGVFGTTGKRLAPPYSHHVNNNLYTDIGPFLPQTVSASVITLYNVLDYPDPRQVGTLSLDKLNPI